jgi:hypothetical protein
VDVEAPFAYSMCSAIRDGDGWHFGADKDATYEVQATATEEASASATLLCRFAQAQATKEHYTVTEDGVSIRIEGDGEIGYALPAFCFDGEVAPRVTFDEHSLTVAYEGWVCKYTTDGSICDLQRAAANRNGHYRVFVATANRTLNVTVEITKA